MEDSVAQWHQYPMGPKLRKYLKVSEEDYKGSLEHTPTDAEKSNFAVFLGSYIDRTPLESPELLEDLLDETVSMDLPLVTLKLSEKYQEKWPSSSFRALNAEGIAGMLAGELDFAAEAFAKAQVTHPEEPGPYVNLAKIYLHSNELESAIEWIKSGLNVEPNNTNLWELAYAVEEQREDAHEDHTYNEIDKLSNTYHSWMGASLAAQIAPTGNAELSAAKLAPFYQQGERDSEFLVEYTGALGAAGDFKKILTIIWDKESRSGGSLPANKSGLHWKLLLHKGQALFSLQRDEEGLVILNQLIENPNLPPGAKEPLLGMIQEVKNEMASRPEGASVVADDVGAVITKPPSPNAELT